MQRIISKLLDNIQAMGIEDRGKVSSLALGVINVDEAIIVIQRIIPKLLKNIQVSMVVVKNGGNVL